MRGSVHALRRRRVDGTALVRASCALVCLATMLVKEESQLGASRTIAVRLFVMSLPTPLLGKNKLELS